MPISVTLMARQPENKKKEVPVFEFSIKSQSLVKAGDIAVFCYWSKKDKSAACYGGIGKVSEILSLNKRRFYVKVQDYRYFEHDVSVTLPDGRYVEQLSNEPVADIQLFSKTCPVRDISQAALDYVINAGGTQHIPEKESMEDVEFYEAELRDAVRSYYVDKEKTAIYSIERLAASIGRATSIVERHSDHSYGNLYIASTPVLERIAALKIYLQSMRMAYPYNPVLVMALLHSGKNGAVSIGKAVQYFQKYYADRRLQGLPTEKRRSIYLREDVTDKQIADNLVSIPVRGLCESGFFFYNEEEQVFSLSPEIWPSLDRASKSAITKICRQRLKEYYSE